MKFQPRLLSGVMYWPRNAHLWLEARFLAVFLAPPAFRVTEAARFLAVFLARRAFLASAFRVGRNRFSIRSAVAELPMAVSASLSLCCTLLPAAAVAAPTVPTASPTISAA